MNKIKIGDIVFCKKSYIDTEIISVFKKYAGNEKFLVHLKQGHKYKVENLTNTQILVKNEFGLNMYYEITRFEELKELRKQKIKKLNENMS